MARPMQRQMRRGSRRERIDGPVNSEPSGSPGIVARLLAFETYTGFQHESIGMLAGLVHGGLLLFARLNARRVRRRR
jgi:hypothetical protein